MTANSSRKIVSLVVVSDPASRLLLVRTAKRAHRWELPGGAVEPGESPMDAALREVREETGVSLVELRLVGLYHGARDDLLRIVFAGTAPVVLKEITSYPSVSEIAEVKWFPMDPLPTPMPVLARRMIHDSVSQSTTVLATVTDDNELE